MAFDKMAINDDQMDQITGGSILPYRVQPGDSLDDIAKKYHVTVDQLMKWNNLQGTSALQVGQQLKIRF